jgi:hypothetical protein
VDKPTGQEALRTLVGVIVGAVLGLAVGAASYLVIEAVLEGRGGWVEELQGLAWNLVPLGAVCGAGVGILVARRR